MINQPTLKLLHAGTLRKPVVECAKLLQETHPEVAISLESYGSRACAIPKNSENPELAQIFLNLILSRQGQQLLEDCGLIPY